jgi:hypothetical protein
MLKVFWFLLFFVILFQTKSQNFTEKEIIGTWKVENVMLGKVPKAELEKSNQLIKAFSGAEFIFKPDKFFSFVLGDDIKDSLLQQMQISNANWKLDDSGNSIIVQDWKERYTDKLELMEILIKKEDGKIKFRISETYMILEVKKQ